MGFLRFRQSFKIMPGVRLNLSGSGASVSLGPRGAHFTIGPHGTRTTVGLPGSGISWTAYQAYSSGNRSPPPDRPLPGPADTESNEATSLDRSATVIDSAPIEQSLRDAGRESQTDVFALVKANNRTIAVAVEGKVNESFGPIIRDWYVDPSPGRQQRLAFLCDLIGVECPPPGDAHYQLFHRAASAVIEAERFKTDDAAMIVHSFSPENKWFDAYAAFLRLFGLAAEPGQLVSKELPDGRSLHFGWAKGDPRFLLA